MVSIRRRGDEEWLFSGPALGTKGLVCRLHGHGQRLRASPYLYCDIEVGVRTISRQRIVASPSISSRRTLCCCRHGAGLVFRKEGMPSAVARPPRDLFYESKTLAENHDRGHSYAIHADTDGVVDVLGPREGEGVHLAVVSHCRALLSCHLEFMMRVGLVCRRGHVDEEESPRSGR